ncbi:Cytochrome c oxidase subunit 2 [Halioglobus japonicus]|nr:Cytochrome c oxidase subunit 2 [Halioglobus japonicus]
MVGLFRLLGACLLLSPALVNAQINMPRGVTPVSQDIYGLHMYVIWIVVGIMAVVYGVIIFSLIRHRKSKGAVAATFSKNNLLELMWTIVPLIIITAIAIPSIRVLIEMDDYDAADLTVKITGHQWKWQYEYLDQGVGFFSTLSTPIEEVIGVEEKNEFYLLEVDEPLVLPTDRKVRFVVTSNDVIHSWWVPELGIKRDAVPGYVYEAWARIQEPGIYRGQCAELCGVNHGFMPIVVKAVPPAEYDKWIAERASAAKTAQGSRSDLTLPEAMKRGAALYDQHCGACHKYDGSGMPPTFPSLRDSSITTGSDINRHIDVVMNGVPNTAMQAFAPQLDDEELAAIITYERNAWEHDTGDLVQPSQIQARRQ